VEVPGGLEPVEFDATAVGGALDNLILNAIQNSNDGTPIVLHAEIEGVWVRLSVSDSGKGVPVNIRELLFEPFATGGRNRLGLGDCARGGGCPWRQRARPTSRRRYDSYPGHSDWTRQMTTVLIVDDETALHDGLSEAVRDLGFEALAAASGLEALAIAATNSPDAVLLDLRMPDLDGLQVLTRLRADSDGAHVPVAIITAHATAANTIEAMRLGAFDHLTKSIGREDLASLLTRMMRSRPLNLRSRHRPTPTAARKVSSVRAIVCARSKRPSAWSQTAMLQY
jgi:CheY-like chemotaxis protein